MRPGPTPDVSELEEGNRPMVVFMTSAGCHYCHDAREVLNRLQHEGAISLREIDLESAEGVAALQKWRVPFPPIMVVDGELFGYGRLSERKLRRHLGRVSH